jgi:acetyl esterase/lipase
MNTNLRISILTFALLSLTLAASEAAAQRQSNPPFELPTSVRMEEDIVFSRPSGRELRLDLFTPEEEGSVLRPAIVFILGSAWNGEGKSRMWRQAAHMASLGFVTISIEHRGKADSPYPAAVDDAKTAVRWLRAHADDYRIDPERVGAAGGSSGGHLASFLGVTPHLRSMTPTTEYSEFSASVRAVVAFNPAEDFTAWPRRGTDTAPGVLLGVSYEENPELWEEASPITHVSASSAAFLLLHGTADRVVPYQQSTEFLDALREVGVRAELFTAEGAGHGFVHSPPWYQPALEQMADFFVETLGADGVGRPVR